MTWVCMIGAIPAAAEAVAAYGRRLMVIAEPDSDVPGAGGVPASVTRHAEMVAVTDLTDSAAVLSAVERLIGVYGTPEAVISFTEYGSVPAAIMSGRLNQRSVSVAAAERARDKRKMRSQLAGTDWEWPWRAGNSDEIVAAVGDELGGGPWVIKPVGGTGSDGLAIVRDAGDVARWAGETRGDGREWIAEKYTNGPHFTIEALSSGGGHRVLGIASQEGVGTSDLAVNGHWHLYPAPVPAEQEAEIWRATSGMLDALGVSEGASHTEVRLDPVHGPVIIETHTRFGGCRIPELIRLASGVSPYEEAVAVALGETPVAAGPARGASCIRFVLAPVAGLLTGLSLPADVLSDPRLHAVGWEASVGDVVSVPRKSDDILGHVITVAEDPKRAWNAAQEFVSAATVQIVAGDVPVPASPSGTPVSPS
jgi:biotin carboxylase